jgi:hypothetical protein
MADDPLKEWMDKNVSTGGPVELPPAPKSVCGNCRFGLPTAQLNQLGCARFPPQIVLLPPNQLLTQFPMVQPTQYCGEHQPKLNS